MMHYQHTTKKAAAAAVTVSILVGGIFLTSRKSEAAVPAANTALSEQKETEQTAAPGFRQLQDDPSLHETLAFSTVRTAFAQHTAAEIDFRRYTNSRREDYDDALNYVLVFTFSFEQETYQLRVSYDKETDQLMDIDITRLSNGQMQWIYTMDEEQGERYPNDLQTFLDTKTEIGDLLTLRLPQGAQGAEPAADGSDCGVQRTAEGRPGDQKEGREEKEGRQEKGPEGREKEAREEEREKEWGRAGRGTCGSGRPAVSLPIRRQALCVDAGIPAGGEGRGAEPRNAV